jgi:hypothetical protein
MVTRKTAAGQAKGKKLKLKRETIKDLGSKKSSAVKGGKGEGTAVSCGDLCTVGCNPSLVFCKPTR